MAGLALSPGALPRSILFLCGMNAVRSPMAEQLARRMLPATVFVASAGVRAGERDPFVDAVLAEEDLTLGERHPRTMDDLEDDYFDLIVTLAPEAHHAALELTRSLAVEVEYWPTPDPTDAGGTREQIMAAHRDVRERL
ncbi:low molecular weight phosphatase family protein, partial [Mesorhizobium sp. M7A.F.Ca.CA.003.01.2.1]